MAERAKLIVQYDRLLKKFADPCRNTIYHYTSAEGLKGIIENSEIWLTNVAFVNDITECKALQMEKDLFNDGELTNEYIKEEWDKFIQGSDINYDTYIASFSSGEESLDQWRAYGNFRIGFEANKLIKRRFNMYKCVYSKSEIKNWIFKKEKVKEWASDSLDDEYKRGAALNLIYAASKKYKNKHFKNEKEFRLIVVSHHTWEPFPNSPSMYKDDPPIHYRDHSAYKMPVPYVKFFIDDDKNKNTAQFETSNEMKGRKLKEEKTKKRGLLPITDILIGPMFHQEEARIACKILLKDKGYENVKVNISDIPYRGF